MKPSRSVCLLAFLSMLLFFSPGFARAQKPVKTIDEEAKVEPAQGQGQGLAQETAKEKKKKFFLISGWAHFGLGAALIVAGAGTGGAALALGSDLKDKCQYGNCLPSEHDDYDRMNRLALSTDILLVLGAAAALSGAIMVAVASRKESPARKSKPKVALSLPAGAILTWEY